LDTLQDRSRDGVELPRHVASRIGHGSDRRRFTKAVLIGQGVAAIPYLWVLWDGWRDPLHRHPSGLFANFYDLQARALFHGRWDVPRGSLSIEGFVVNGREYLYFPPFPSLLRMPVLALTDSFDGRLTAPSMLLAWVVTGVFASLLLWRVRLLVRGAVVLGRAEAGVFAVLIATIMSGSVLLYLASLPWVFHEAFAWGVAMTTGALFALLGVLERPSAGRVFATGALTLGAVLSRTTIGWGAVIAVFLTAVWFANGRGGEERRRWWLPILAAGLVPFVVGCLVTWVKFGTFFMHPLSAQVFTKISPHRRHALAANGGGLLNVSFAPTTLLAYLRPDGLRFAAVYPFITLPATPARPVGNVVFDQMYRTASVPASMPMLFLLAAWGVVTAFRPRQVGSAGLMRIALIGGAAGTGGVFFYGYIGNRYLADFVPLLILAGAVGLVDLWRRAEGRDKRMRAGALLTVAALALFGLAANLGVVIQTQHLAFEGERVRNYVELQQSISDVTGHPLNDNVVRGARLPRWAPADQLFVVGNCAGLYISTGEHEFPQWLLVERGPGHRHNFDVVYNEVDRGRVPLVTVGEDPPITVWMEDYPVAYTRWLRFRVDGLSGRNVISRSASLKPGRTYRISVVTDTALDRVSVAVNGEQVLDERLKLSLPAVAHSSTSQPGGQPLPVSVVERPTRLPGLCRSLAGSKS
jgi:MFS family permease